MSLGHLARDASLLGRAHRLPATIFEHLLHATLARRRFRDEQIGAFRNLDNGLAGAGVAGKHNHAIERFETVGIGLMLAGSRALMESKVAVFDRRYFDIRVLINQTRAYIMTVKYAFDRYAATSIGNPDLGTDTEIAQQP